LLFQLKANAKRQMATGTVNNGCYGPGEGEGFGCLEHAKQVVVLIIITNCFWHSGPTNDLATLKTEYKKKRKKTLLVWEKMARANTYIQIEKFAATPYIFAN